MEPAEFQRLSRLFEQARLLHGDERAQFLDEAAPAGSASRTELDRLLALYETGDEQLHVLGEAARSLMSELADGDVPKSIGPYEIVREIGSGGMGVVYLADQTAPLRRQVALKVIRLGMNSREVIARFERERQSLARLSHPGIAQVFAAGTLPDGRPYFAMEYVEGQPITAWCDAKRLDPDARMRLFIEVCEAVEHAHQKGIIHRDLKPSNILVTEREGKPLAKVIDFGIARATDEDDGGALLTKVGRFVGTPAYMSPEQSSLDTTAIDTRTDIYSLGAIFYELLVGVLPFDTDTLARAGYAEMHRILREQDPPRPSARFDKLGPRSTVSAERRSVEPSSLVRRLRGDPDWITMKALEKEPKRRYASAGAFAQDIQRHLANEPIEARPPSRRYQLQKFVQRNRTVVIAGCLLLATLLAGLWVSTSQYFKAESARALSEKRLKKVQRMADKQVLADLTAEAESLWPALPERESALSGWIERAEALLTRLPNYQDEFNVLRPNGRPAPRRPNDETLIQLTRFRSERAARVRDIAVYDEKPKPLPPEVIARIRLMTQDIDRIDAKIEPLQAEANRRKRLVFEDAEDQHTYDLLESLVYGMTSFAKDDGLLADVRRRLDEAKSARSTTIDAHRETWQAVAKALAADNRYADVVLPPQVGLVPLGADPRSGLLEFAVAATGDVPTRDAESELVLDDESALVLVLLPAGTIRLGAIRPKPDGPKAGPNIDPMARPYEQPLHTITLNAFFLSKFEMTQAQYMRVMGKNPSSYFVGCRAGPHLVTLRNPVESISWHTTRSALNRVGLVLPTEAQWEYAARAGTTTPWWSGSSVESIKDKVNIADLSARREGVQWASKAWDKLDDGHVTHAPVGTFPPNPWGFHEMMGNVREWCLDAFGRYDAPFREGDGLRLEYYDGDLFSSRGGSYSGRPITTRSANRGATKAEIAEAWIGVRPARTIRAP